MTRLVNVSVVPVNAFAPLMTDGPRSLNRNDVSCTGLVSKVACVPVSATELAGCRRLTLPGPVRLSVAAPPVKL